MFMGQVPGVSRILYSPGRNSRPKSATFNGAPYSNARKSRPRSANVKGAAFIARITL
jgi:hypothetical protein